MRAPGHDLFLVAGRLPQHRVPTLQWLAGQGLGDAFVEDKRRTAEALVTLPLTVFLLDRPWNRGPALPGLTRVRTWAEVLAHITTVSGKIRIRRSALASAFSNALG